jgi:hypothetical protein
MMILGDALRLEGACNHPHKKNTSKIIRILGINVREFFLEEGLIAKRVLGMRSLLN